MVMKKVDFIVIGCGIAGLTAAYELSSRGTVALLTKSSRSDSATAWAQGGIAVVLNQADSPELHIQDTLNAGNGLCDESIVSILVNEGIDRVNDLIQLGVNFDRTDDGLSFGQEAAHQKRRILHVGDATGREIEMVLGRAVLGQPSVTLYDHAVVTQLIVDDSECKGCIFVQHNRQFVLTANAVVLATGGIGQLYQHTSNPAGSTGDGIALALDVGCDVRDMEFIQFHPTVFFQSHFLITEAARGEGGVLRDHLGDAFMSRYHADAELAPRDVVSRAIWNEMNQSAQSCVYLDLTTCLVDLKCRFPTIYSFCHSKGIDIRKDWIPVTPAAHYLMGGIAVDSVGQTSLSRLYAVGEVACNGAHGANRLASNSLLEGLVFGYRAAHHASTRLPLSSTARCQLVDQEPMVVNHSARKQLKSIMWNCVGIIRHKDHLKRAFADIQMLDYGQDHELRRMCMVALEIVKAALNRPESVGSHQLVSNLDGFIKR